MNIHSPGQVPGRSLQEADTLLLRFGEFTLKGKNRVRFEKVIYRQVREMVKPYPQVKLLREFGRIYVALNGAPAEPLAEALRKLFGIASVSPVRTADSELQAIIEAARSFMEALAPEPGTTFKVNARRVDKAFPHGSQELNRLVSGPILQQFGHLRVDVHHPQVELRVEVRENGTYLFCENLPGVGGFPLGTNGKALLLLSGGIDSPVAGWSAMRRGLEVECVHFYSYPYTSREARQKVIDLTRRLSRYAGSVTLHLVPFTEVQTAFTGIGQDNLMVTLMRRAMLRISTRLAEREGALALVTGESLGQVASQTLPSMNVIGRATDLPLLRPLVTMDKNEIIALAQEIGTYETSILPFEDCCTLFVPKSPTTNPNLRIVERIEATLPGYEERLAAAVGRTETLCITPFGNERPADEAGESAIDEGWF
ncbi:tRNA 4-thiouridine(8) synthase ThiI [Paenibacillus spiritus]|uniref:Probable tRNA sulfurtransferase n=1 Tax=Paenibacillus spiritus TaxID=2496557 RepID=A0A5J5GHQ9_9BACL|nr:tRNA uracil 4-sulfurtransferase ThiI [Paenibacillus spiritus]KAA9007627.1 tRNA 4-thiouridine(8) synthase ThiI [Paenibacillus spiritus]